jgi:hypothetical protein
MPRACNWEVSIDLKCLREEGKEAWDLNYDEFKWSKISKKNS